MVLTETEPWVPFLEERPVFVAEFQSSTQEGDHLLAIVILLLPEGPKIPSHHLSLLRWYDATELIFPEDGAERVLRISIIRTRSASFPVPKAIVHVRRPVLNHFVVFLLRVEGDRLLVFLVRGCLGNGSCVRRFDHQQSGIRLGEGVDPVKELIVGRPTSTLSSACEIEGEK